MGEGGRDEVCWWVSLLNVEWRLAQVLLDLKGCQKEFQMDSSLFEFFSSVSLSGHGVQPVSFFFFFFSELFSLSPALVVECTILA